MDIMTLTDGLPLASFFVMFGRSTPIVFIVVPVILAYVIYFIAKKVRSPQMRIFAYLPLAIGVIIGILAQVQFANEPMFLSFHDFGSRSVALYWGIIVVPILAAIIMFVAGKLSRSGIDADL